MKLRICHTYFIRFNPNQTCSRMFKENDQYCKGCKYQNLINPLFERMKK